MSTQKKARIIYQTPHGYTFRSEEDDLIHLEFQNLIFTFDPDGLKRFRTFIDLVDIEAGEKAHSDTIRARTIILDVRSTGMKFAFFKYEFVEFKLLLEGTEAMLKLFHYARQAKISVN